MRDGQLFLPRGQSTPRPRRNDSKQLDLPTLNRLLEKPLLMMLSSSCASLFDEQTLPIRLGIRQQSFKSSPKRELINNSTTGHSRNKHPYTCCRRT